MAMHRQADQDWVYYPRGNRILFERFAAEDVSRGGIIIPDAAKEHPLLATVRAIGEGQTIIDKDTGAVKVLPIRNLQVGDVIVIDIHSAVPVEKARAGSKDSRLGIIGVEDILATVTMPHAEKSDVDRQRKETPC